MTRGPAALLAPPLLALAPVLALAACADEEARPADPRPLASVSPTASAGGPTADTASAPDEPTAAYLAWLGALEDRDAASACRIQHPERTIALRYEAILVDRAELGDPCVGFEALLWEDPLREYSPVDVETTRLTGEKATLAVTFPGSAVTVELELQRAAWRVLSEERRTPSSPATAQWVGVWCDLELGASRADVVAAMGEPSGEYTDSDGGEPQVYWAADQYDFRAYLDPIDGTVTDLVGDYDALSAADRERLDCPELR
ncbi:hypothetical protein [uncultured Nocardioides sp.]|uniref:hypothetical protein n=1 Tax=uncultured Nocardioides sp. TaxID=198441 RepID=UPI0026164AEC|nr:hypothetical protein [uncultured Nocardioides sp.]